MTTFQVLRVAAVLVAGVAGCRTAEGPSRPLSDLDRVAIRGIDTAFVNGWIADDTTRILQLFDPDAILLPPGSHPVVGIAAIRSFWWPADGSHTRIVRFARRIDEIGGEGGSAFLRATATLTWDYDKAGQRSSQTSRSTDLLIRARGVTGRWRISRQMWIPLPADSSR